MFSEALNVQLQTTFSDFVVLKNLIVGFGFGKLDCELIPFSAELSARKPRKRREEPFPVEVIELLLVAKRAIAVCAQEQIHKYVQAAEDRLRSRGGA
jgi:hypothetical protein